MTTTVKVSARIPRGLAERMDRLIEEGLYSNRSEIIKEALRDFLLRRNVGDLEAMGYLKAVEEVLKDDWNSEADEYWDDVGGVPYEARE